MSDYRNLFSCLNINKGDVIFVSSDISNIAYYFFLTGYVFSPDIFIDTIIELIGDTGTLIFPTYNWDFCKGSAFDYKNTKSKVGSLTNAALRRSDFKRTKHPIYSFAVHGRDKDLLCSMGNKSSFGHDSPFSYFYERYAKNLFFDVGYQDSATFVHHLEEKHGVEYRFMKEFTAGYIDENGGESQRTYSMYVRHLDMEIVHFFDMHELFVADGALEEITVEGSLLRLLDMRKAYKIVEDDILNNLSRRIVRYGSPLGKIYQKML